MSFLYDDFFDTGEGITIPVKIKGREVPITIKKGISNADRAAAETRAIKRTLKDGKLVYDGVDEQRAMEELLLAVILDWPFVHRDGTKVKVTREAIRNLLGGADAIMEAITKIEAGEADSLTPFVENSGQP